jgi:DNA topoisomerase-1
MASGRLRVSLEQMPRTRRVDCSQPGIARRRRGRGFVYLDAGGAHVEDAQTLARIRALAIPPAWQEVWICRDPRGHIQATGIDDAGRKQYRYHDDWRTRRDAAKFEAMLAFGEALPRLRRRVARDLRGESLEQTRVHAGAVRLLDVGFFRVGSEDYAQRNGSYGLTTLLKRHVRVRQDGLLFDFPAKSGQRRRQLVADPDARRLVAALSRRRGGGPELLVALLLGNTPAVCRASYIDPRVLDRFHAGHTVAALLAARTEPQPEAPIQAPSIHERVRRAVLELITG